MLVTIMNDNDLNTLCFPFWTPRNLKLQENVKMDQFISHFHLCMRSVDIEEKMTNQLIEAHLGS